MSDNDVSQDLPVYTRWNPPGRKELSYRAGTYTTVLSRLMTYLAERQEPQNQLPELQLNTDPQENWGVGLLQAWAIVIDVLTFYQERIANEGYLSTATERRSVLELARSTGYELRPWRFGQYLPCIYRRSGQEWNIATQCHPRRHHRAERSHAGPASAHVSRSRKTTLIAPASSNL